MDRDKVCKVLQDVEEFYRTNPEAWFLSQELSLRLTDQGLHPAAVARFFRHGGKYEILAAALQGVDIYA